MIKSAEIWEELMDAQREIGRLESENEQLREAIAMVTKKAVEGSQPQGFYMKGDE